MLSFHGDKTYFSPSLADLKAPCVNNPQYKHHYYGLICKQSDLIKTQGRAFQQL